MILANLQPFCKKYNRNLGIYFQKQRSILPKTTTESRISLDIHKNHFCVIWKKNQSSFPDAIKEVLGSF